MAPQLSFHGHSIAVTAPISMASSSRVSIGCKPETFALGRLQFLANRSFGICCSEQFASEVLNYYTRRRNFKSFFSQPLFLNRKRFQHSSDMAKKTMAMAGSSFEILEGQSRSFHELPSGLKMEVIQQLAQHTNKPDGNLKKEKNPPIVFLHGSYHAAWCWAIHWLPFFSTKGHDCYALSFLGQGESDIPSAGVGGTLQSHARDVAHFIRHKLPEKPFLVGHSFGGLIVQQYLAPNMNSHSDSQPSSEAGDEEPFPELTAAVLACSVPPTGNGPIVQRYLMSRPFASIKVTLSLAAKAFAYSESLCRETFFSSSMPLYLVQRYQQLLIKSSSVPLFNLRELNASLPVDIPIENAPPVLVIGAEDDFIVDIQGVQETADAYGKDLVVVPSIAHDIMLDVAWESAVEIVAAWLEQKGPKHMQAATKK